MRTRLVRRSDRFASLALLSLASPSHAQEGSTGDADANVVVSGGVSVGEPLPDPRRGTVHFQSVEGPLSVSILRAGAISAGAGGAFHGSFSIVTSQPVCETPCEIQFRRGPYRVEIDDAGVIPLAVAAGSSQSYAARPSHLAGEIVGVFLSSFAATGLAAGGTFAAIGAATGQASRTETGIAVTAASLPVLAFGIWELVSSWGGIERVR